jgi:hypothetical protein
MWTAQQDNLGEIQEQEYGKWFTYRATADEWAILNNLPFEIDVLDGVRYARVLKTVAYVAVDEDEMGLPVVEKWSLKNHNPYVARL